MNITPKQRFTQLVEKLSSIDPILVVGDLGIDKYTFGDVSRISPEAPVPVLRVEKEWDKLGLAANISHNLQTLGIGSTLVGVIGNDDKATKFESMLEECDLSTWGVVRDKTRSTTFKERVTTNVQQICRIDYESSADINKDVEEKILERVNEFIDKHSAVIIEDYNKGLVSESLAQKIIDLCKKKKKFVAVDPYRSKPAKIYSGTDLIKPNLAEAKQLVNGLGSHDYEPENMCRLLAKELNISQVALTLGAGGMALFDGKADLFKVIPTVANEVFDVSGAGDTVISTLVASLISEGSLEEAAWVSNCAAGVVVSKKGTATVTREELLDFYETLSKRVH